MQWKWAKVIHNFYKLNCLKKITFLQRFSVKCQTCFKLQGIILTDFDCVLQVSHWERTGSWPSRGWRKTMRACTSVQPRTMWASREQVLLLLCSVIPSCTLPSQIQLCYTWLYKLHHYMGSATPPSYFANDGILFPQSVCVRLRITLNSLIIIAFSLFSIEAHQRPCWHSCFLVTMTNRSALVSVWKVSPDRKSVAHRNAKWIPSRVLWSRLWLRVLTLRTWPLWSVKRSTNECKEIDCCNSPGTGNTP